MSGKCGVFVVFNILYRCIYIKFVVNIFSKYNVFVVFTTVNHCIHVIRVVNQNFMFYVCCLQDAIQLVPLKSNPKVEGVIGVKGECIASSDWFNAEELLEYLLGHIEIKSVKGAVTGKSQSTFASHIPWLMAYYYHCGEDGMAPITRKTFDNDLLYKCVCNHISVLEHNYPSQIARLVLYSNDRQLTTPSKQMNSHSSNFQREFRAGIWNRTNSCSKEFGQMLYKAHYRALKKLRFPFRAQPSSNV
jgi:hypothetical protein